MALAAYEAWMALEERAKYCVISSERSAMMARVRALMPGEHLSVGGPVVTLEKPEDVMAVMARVGDDHPSVGGRVVTLKEQEAVMHVMALEQYEKCLAVRIEAVLICLDPDNVYEHALQAILRGGPDQALVDLDEANLDMANTYNNIAGVYKTQGKCEMAYLPVLGPGLLDNASVADFGKYEMALVHYEKCLAIRIKVLGENHVDVCKTQLNIAEVHEAVCRANMMRCRAIAAVHSVAADTRFLEESRAAEEASAVSTVLVGGARWSER